eukprot:COSAG06_NODE_15039_length_1102_cov_1.205384_2_plen_55_part_01
MEIEFFIGVPPAGFALLCSTVLPCASLFLIPSPPYATMIQPSLARKVAATAELFY